MRPEGLLWRTDPKRWLSLPSVKGSPSTSRPCSDLGTSLPALIKQTYLLGGLSAVPCGLVTEKSSSGPCIYTIFSKESWLPFSVFEDFWFLDTWLKLVCGCDLQFNCWFLCSSVTALGFNKITQNLKVLDFCLCGSQCEGIMSGLTSMTFKEPSHVVVKRSH